jgi:hypothetical protein
VLLQQPVEGRARQAAVGHAAGRFKQLPDLPDRAPRVIPFGRKNGDLSGQGQFRLPAIDPRLWRQPINSLFPPSVEPA